MENQLEPIELEKPLTWKDRIFSMKIGERRAYAVKYSPSIKFVNWQLKNEKGLSFKTEIQGDRVIVERLLDVQV